MTTITPLTASSNTKVSFGRKPECEEFLQIKKSIETHFGPEHAEGLHPNAVMVTDDNSNRSLLYKLYSLLTLKPIRELLSDVIRHIVYIVKIAWKNGNAPKPSEIKTVFVTYFNSEEKAQKTYEGIKKRLEDSQVLKTISLKLIDGKTLISLHSSLLKPLSVPKTDKVLDEAKTN